MKQDTKNPLKRRFFRKKNRDVKIISREIRLPCRSLMHTAFSGQNCSTKTSMNTHLFFCGIKHSGKSTLGRLVARNLLCPWVDSDDLILSLHEEGTTIRSLYQKEGKQSFMDWECKAVSTFLKSAEEPSIVSLGGGACDNQALMSLIQKHGKIIYLMVEEKVLLNRILTTGLPPFLDPENIEESFSGLYAHRHALYSTMADFLVCLPDYPDVHDTADFLLQKLTKEVL